MINSNKIIPFKQVTPRKKSELRLKNELSFYICRNGEKYICDCASENPDDTIEEIIYILKKILQKISTTIHGIEIKSVDCYELCFTILYYEDSANIDNWKFLYVPQNIELEKLAEYIYTFISIYEYKKSLH